MLLRMPDIETALQAIFRWFHILAGITWIGHLYFFNFVNTPFQGGLAKELKPTVNPPLVLRALFFFRWGAMWTFLFGIALFSMIYWPMGGNLFTPEGRMSERGMWVLFGGLLGTIMWFNVWFVIWPRQQVIMAAVGGKREKPADFDALVAKAALFSKINTYLSFPMLFGMGGRSHLPVAKNWGEQIGWWVGVLLVGVGIAVHVVKHAAPKVGLEFLPDAPPPAPAAPPPAAK